MTNPRTEALAAARDLANQRGDFTAGMCLREIRQLYDIAAHDFTPGDNRSPDAAEAWRYAQHQHRLTSADQLVDVPAGVPVFWVGGSAGHGHVGMKAGGLVPTHDVWSTDFLEVGRLDRVDGRRIGPKWGMTLAGWTEDLNRVRIYTPPTHTENQEDDMSWTDEFNQWDGPDDDTSGDKMKASQQLSQARGYARAAYRTVKTLEAKVDELTRAVAALTKAVR